MAKCQNNSKSARKKATKVDRRSVLKAAASLTAVMGLLGNRSVAAERSESRLVQLGSRARNMDSPLKQQAANDYCRSLQQYGGKLSCSTRELFLTAERKDEIHFGVVVVGSGYGASIAAARLSQRLRPDYRICILERGKEWVPGTFPDSRTSLNENPTASVAGPAKGKGYNPLGLMNMTMNDEVNIMSGNGLGGGSLINASICLRPHPEVFEQSRWPTALHDVEVLGPYYDGVAANLNLNRTPYDQTPKVRLRRQAAERLSGVQCFYDRSNVSVTYDHRFLDDQMRNQHGMIQRQCTLCGDCITGCNVGAKNSLSMNYLPMARRNGTEIFTQMEVKSIEKKCGYYRINIEYIDDTQDKFTRHPLSINSRVVVVGAGSPASAAILMESESEGFCFSPKLGHNWSANGDTVGFIVDLPPGTNIGGFGAYPKTCKAVGPTVQTSLNYYREIELRRRLLIQEAAIPRAAGNVFAFLLRDAALDRSMVMLGMGHDEATGRIEKRKGRYQVKWEGLKDSAYRKMVFGEFERLAAAHGGRYKRLKAFGDNMVTVHPLGGCPMSDCPSNGATNHLGQVFDYAGGGDVDPRTGQMAVHNGLYVADGSLIPTALGVNPFMTIGALSDRVATHIVANPINQDLFA